MISSTFPRIHFLDHLRGFAFALMVIDHSLHAYALYWGKYWFFQDNDRSLFFDVLYMHNNSIIIPLLFFVIGTFVIPGMEKYELKNYLKNRFFRYVVPFCIGIPLSVPILTYPKYVTTEAPGISFFDYWWTIFFTEKLQGGPLWVVNMLLVYTLIAIVCYLHIPIIFQGFRRWVKWMITHPIPGVICFGMVSMVILGITDLLWGAPWWIGFGKVFYVQGSRFLQQALFFFCGVALGTLGIEKAEMWKPLSQHWMIWVSLTFITGCVYIWYSLTYFNEGAYDNEILYHFHRGGNWRTLWPIIWEIAPMRLIRTTLHGFFCLFQLLMLLSLFHRVFQKPTPFWTSLAANGFGIFLIHEMIVVLCQYWMNAQSFPIFFKFLFVALVGLGGAWILSAYLRTLPGIRRVIGLYPHSYPS